MKIMNIPFSPPDVGDAEITEVAEVLRSGWITTGPKTKLLEKKVANWLNVGCSNEGTPRCVCLNSQTACAEMALRLMEIGEDAGGSADDEVIVPAYTYTASASVVRHVNAKLVIVDIQKDGLQMDYSALEKAINEHTKAIIPVDIAGIPCDYDTIFDIVEKKKDCFKATGIMQEAFGRIVILEDAAHAFGAKWHGDMIGCVADFTSFSWHAVKNFTTGEGGCLTWRKIDTISDETIYHKLQLLSLHGQSKDALAKNKLGMWEYDIIGTWYKCNMTDITAAIGLAQFESYPQKLRRREDIIIEYDKAFAGMDLDVLNHYSNDYMSSGHLYLTRVRGIGEQERNEIIVRMAEHGVSCNVHYKPLPLHTAYKKLGFNIADYPNAYDCYKNEITLPLHTKLSDDEVTYVVEVYKRIVGDYLK